jgi:hypothetical protein
MEIIFVMFWSQVGRVLMVSGRSGIVCGKVSRNVAEIILSVHFSITI